MIAEVQEENGELFIEIPEEMLKELGWNIGDELLWEIQEDNTIVLKRAGIV